MARSKNANKATRSRSMIELPKGYAAINAGSSWDYKAKPILEGIISGFRTVTSTKYFEKVDGKKVPKEQRVCDLETKDGAVSVYESASLSSLFDQKKGARVCLIFQGLKKIEGRDQPMKLFTVGVRK